MNRQDDSGRPFSRAGRAGAVAVLGMALLGWLAIPGVQAAWIDDWRSSHPVWRGVHVLLHGEEGARALEAEIPELAGAGINVLIAEVNYGFDYESHPELRGGGGGLSKATAARLATSCRTAGIRLIPQFSCLGHQSWDKTTHPLLKVYPDLDETPGRFPENKGIYCRSWCPQNPRVLEIVLPMLDELLNAFDADALHVGLDEAFLIASEHCPRCRGGNPAELFARAAQDLHQHLVGRRGVEMLMWADRLLDSATTGYGEWEAAKNGTAPAVDRIPKDVILCDWHYEPLSKYPGKPKDYVSVPYLMEKGFRVWPSGWKTVEAVEALVDSASRHRGERMLGYLVTTWGAVRTENLAEWPPLRAGMARLRERE